MSEHPITLSRELFERVDQFLHLFKLYVKAVERGSRPEFAIQGGKFMFIVPDNQADVAFTLVAPKVVDAEGHALDPQPALTATVVSDNPDAVAITFDPTGLKGSASFGAPGIANVNATFTDAADNLVGSFGAQFTVTTGAAASITGGGITFEGLTEAVVPAP